ncbi:MAG: glycoside hydrolase family 127 protein, partial [Muribaculaceae bacterium]|nr:glycoside hydrolase family 127 protein [Muribaculaceae bacterium]
MNKYVMALGLLCCSVWTGGAQSVYPGQHGARIKVETTGVPVKSFDLHEVKLLPGRVRDNLERDSAWMVSIEVNRLLHSFRNNAGVYAGVEGGYESVRKLGGWESLDCDLRGHITGHLLSAYGLMYAATGAEVFKLKGDSLVTGLAEVQQALDRNGYLSAYPEELINRNMRGKSVWAPWYTLHKLYAGLIDQYLYAGNDEALRVVTGMGDWAYDKLHGQSEETRRLMLRNEFGGVNESFYNLYAITGDRRYMELARYFYHNDVIDPLKDGNYDFGTKHTNTFIPK